MALGRTLRSARERRDLTPSQVAAATRMKVQIVEALEREDFNRIPAPIYAKGFIKLYAEFVGLDPRPLVEEYAALLDNPKRPSLVSERPRGEPAPPAACEFRLSEEPAAEVAEPGDAERPDSPPSEPGPTAEAPAAPDLFEHAQSREAAAAMAPPPAEPSAEAEGLGEVGDEGFADLWRKTTRFVREQGRSVRASLGAQRPDGIPRDLRRFWPRCIPIVVGALIVLILLGSALNRCAAPAPRAREAGSRATEDSGALRVAAEPPEPYVD